MCRGYEGNKIFFDDELKKAFIDFLEESADKHHIHLLSFCVMDNHYHLILQNNGRMSDFFKFLNGKYGALYRKIRGGTGYVFQGRYKSTLIQDETYLRTAIAYVLGNPIRAGITEQYRDYKWSSGYLYFKNSSLSIIDTAFVEELFGSEEQLSEFIESWTETGELQTIKTDLGNLLGEKSAYYRLKQGQNRRKRELSIEHRRKKEEVVSVKAVVRDFIKETGISPSEIDTHTLKGLRLRRKLLVMLKDMSGLTYREIARLNWFKDVKIGSMGKMYSDGKRK